LSLKGEDPYGESLVAKGIEYALIESMAVIKFFSNE
jgi:hypothetical protein